MYELYQIDFNTWEARITIQDGTEYIKITGDLDTALRKVKEAAKAYNGVRISDSEIKFTVIPPKGGSGTAPPKTPKAKPISPEQLNSYNFPLDDVVIEVINNLIRTKFMGQYAIVTENDILEELIKRKGLSSCNLLPLPESVISLYKKSGWYAVTYTSNTTTPYYTFYK